MIDRFRRKVYQSFEQRADAGMALIGAPTGAMTVDTGSTERVALSTLPRHTMYSAADQALKPNMLIHVRPFTRTWQSIPFDTGFWIGG